MTIWRGPGGTGSASSEVDTTEFQQFLVQAQAAKVAAEAAQAAALVSENNAELAEANAETAETNAEAAATTATSAASSASTSATNAASSATAAATSASEAAASATSINPANLVHISGTETITGAKTFSSTITGSISGNAGTVTNGVYTSGSYADPSWLTSIAGSKVSGNISGNAANVTGTVAVANGGTGSTTASGARTNLGLVIGTDVLAPNGSAANLTSFPTLNQNTTGSAGSVTGNATGSTFGFNSGYGSVATAYGCRAWVNFNGTGTVAIRASGNVSSITDNSTGNYTVNFTTAMPDANYSVCGAQADTFGVGGQFNVISGQTTSSVQIVTTNYTGASFQDKSGVNVSIFR